MDPSTGLVEATDTKAAHLAGAQSAVGGEQDEEAVVVADRVGESGDLVGVEEVRFDSAGPGQVDAAGGVRAQGSCVAGVVEDEREDRRDVPHPGRGQPFGGEFGDPLLDLGPVDGAERPVGPAGEHSLVQGLAVAVAGRRLERGGRLVPGLGPGADDRLLQLRVGPLAALHVGADALEVLAGVDLAVEGSAA